MHRETSPLKQAKDAVLVDSSEMNIDEVVDAILSDLCEGYREYECNLGKERGLLLRGKTGRGYGI